MDDNELYQKIDEALNKGNLHITTPPNLQPFPSSIDSQGTPLKATSMMNNTSPAPSQGGVLGGVENIVGNAMNSIGTAVGNAIQSASESTIGAGNPLELLGTSQDPLGHSISTWVKNLPVYRAVMMTPEQQLQDATTVGTALGVNPQVLVDNPMLYSRAKDIYDDRQNKAFLQGRNFEDLGELYPELKNMGSVETAIALKKADDIIRTRNMIDMASNIGAGVISGISGAGKWIQTGWSQSDIDYQMGQVGDEARAGKITTEEMNTRLKALESDKKEAEPKTTTEKIAYGIGQTGGQLKTMANHEGAALAAALIPGAGMASIFHFQNLPQSLSLSAGSGIAFALGRSSSALENMASWAVKKMTPGMFASTVFTNSYNMNAGMRYAQMVNTKNPDGSNVYTPEEASASAVRVGAVDALIDANLMERIYGPVTKVLGKESAEELIKNAAAQQALLNVGKSAARAMALKEGMKQYGKAVGWNLAQEGAQDIVGNVDENLIGKNVQSVGAILSSAANAMLQAAPAILGMSIPAAAGTAAGRYAGLRRIPDEVWNTAQEETAREMEAELSRNLIEDRMTNKTFKTNPDIYGKTLQNKMNASGMGTIYVDAASLAETDKGQDALNTLVDRGVVTADEVSKSIADGSQLGIQVGQYFQKIPDENIQEIMNDYTTMNKDGRTMHDIKANRDRIQKLYEDLKSRQNMQESQAAQEILDKDFSEDDVRRTAAADVFSRGMENLQENWRQAKKEAFQRWGDLINYDYYKNYQPEGIGIAKTDGIYGDGRGIRLSNNEQWYREAYAEKGKRPNQRLLYDIAEHDTRRQMDGAEEGREELPAWEQSVKEAREYAEAMEGLEDYFKSVDTGDILARTQLSKEAYEKVYLPALNTLTGKIKSARDSALLNAKITDILSKQYHIPVEEVAATIKMGGNIQKKAYGMPVNADVDPERQVQVVNLDRWVNKPSQKDILQYLRSLAGQNFHMSTADRKAVISILNKDARHITYSGNRERLTYQNFLNRTNSILNIPNLIKNAVLVESIPNRKSDVKPGVYFYHRFYVPVKVKNKIYTVRIVAEEKNGVITVDPSAVNLYDVIIEKRSIAAKGVSPLVRPNGPSTVTIQDMLKGVKDSDHNSYYQRVFHGSPYTFDKFDLGNIGTGEGAQAHGWGLYFAKDREVAVNYRSMKNNEMTYKGKDIQNLYDDLQRKGDYDKLSVLEDFMVQQDIGLLDMDDYEPSAVKWFNKQIYPHIKRESSLFETEIPDESVLLDEDKPLSEQPESVRNSILQYYRSRPDDYIVPSDPGKLGQGSGQKFYSEVAYQMRREGKENPERAASELLNKLGIKGISYDGGRDGRSYVIFDDKAVNIINRYNQGYAGSYDPAENVIHLFDQANASTVIHESAHMYLTTLEKLSRGSHATPELLQDLKTIRKWAEYSEDTLAEYKDTPLEKEFQEYAGEIKRTGSMESQERFAQERFARGFERYLMTGTAPTKELQGTFRRFKTWLTELYREIKNLGKEPPQEIKDIFDHMLAIDDEINAWAAEKRLGEMDRAYDFTKSEKENIKLWIDNIKETVKEKVMRDFMDDYKIALQDNFEKAVPDMRHDYEKQLMEENPIYRTEEIFRSDIYSSEAKKREFLRTAGFADSIDFEKALEEAGGSMKERADAYIEEQRKQMTDALLTPQAIKDAAEAELQSPHGKSQLALKETDAMRNKLNRYIRDIVRAETELKGNRVSVNDIKERLGLLTKEEQEARTEKRERKDLKEQLKEQKEKNKQTQEEAQERVKNNQREAQKLRLELREMRNNLKSAQTSLDIPLKEVYKSAREKLGQETVAKATVWKWWDAKADQAGKQAAKALAAQRWNEASEAKRNQIVYSAMARVARENEAELKEIFHGNIKPETMEKTQDGMEKYGLLGLLNRVGRKKDPVRMEENTRYFIQHMAYQLSIVPEDGILPIDEQGNTLPFEWERIYKSLDADRTMDQPGASNNDIIPDWIRRQFDGEKKVYTNLTMDDFRDMVKVLKAVYHAGRSEYTPRTWGNKSFDEVAETLTKTPWKSRDGVSLADRLGQTDKDIAKDNIGTAVMDAARPEVILERMGKEWLEYIYDPVDRADGVDMKLKEEAKKGARGNFDMYTDKEWAAIRGEHKYFLPGSGGDRATKENILVIALNWGTKDNRARILESLHLTEKDEAELENYLALYMDDKDWQFVQSVWDHIDSFWARDNAAYQRLYGEPMGKVKGMKFTINGREIEGKYYPIVYDPKLGEKASDRDINDAIRSQMSSESFSMGMNSTKLRKKTSGGQTVYMYLDPYIYHLNEVTHRIAMRETITDVYKLLTRKDIADEIEGRIGLDGYNLLKKWASDVWKPPVEKMGWFERQMKDFVRRSSFAVMAYRTSTAVLNASQIAVMAAYMGPQKALSAFIKFHFGSGSHIGALFSGKDFFKITSENRDFVIGKSAMMRERSNTMDKDLAKELAIPMRRNAKQYDAAKETFYEPVQRTAYKMIAETDMMFSLTQWKYTYDEVLQKSIDTGMDAKAAETKAIQEADRGVRFCFGSSRVKDLTNVQKSQLVSTFVPFYSWASTLLNLFIRAGYKAKDEGNWKPMINSILYAWILQATMDSLMRSWTGGDDADDTKRRLISSVISGGPGQGIPYFRDFIQSVGNIAAGQPTYSTGQNIVGLSVFGEATKTIQAAVSNKKDWVDVGRGVSRTTNRIIGFPDTISDGFWTLMRVMFSDTEASAWDILAAIAFDKRIDKDKKKNGGSK